MRSKKMPLLSSLATNVVGRTDVVKRWCGKLPRCRRAHDHVAAKAFGGGGGSQICSKPIASTPLCATASLRCGAADATFNVAARPLRCRLLVSCRAIAVAPAWRLEGVAGSSRCGKYVATPPPCFLQRPCWGNSAAPRRQRRLSMLYETHVNAVSLCQALLCPRSVAWATATWQRRRQLSTLLRFN